MVATKKIPRFNLSKFFLGFGIFLLWVTNIILSSSNINYSSNVNLSRNFPLSEYTLVQNNTLKDIAPQEEKESLVLIQDNTLQAIINPVQIQSIIFAIKLDVIEECESKGNPTICNQEFGCSSGQGLFQIVPSTVRHCEIMLNKKIDPLNPEDNLECAEYLLYFEGDEHWVQSKECWNPKYLEAIKNII